MPLGALLALALLAALLTPCEQGWCARDVAHGVESAQTATPETPLPLPEIAGHCALHYGLLLAPLASIAFLAALVTGLPLAAPALRARLTAPPPLPPPQFG